LQLYIQSSNVYYILLLLQVGYKQNDTNQVMLFCNNWVTCVLGDCIMLCPVWQY